MNDLKIFQNDAFGEVRVTNINNEPYFCLSDICKALELSNPSKVKTRLNAKGMINVNLNTLTNSEGINNSVGNPNATFITEANLYKCIFQSRTDRAESFQDWVTGEVLPSIRKTGKYDMQGTYNMPKTFAEALRLAADQQELIEQKQIQIEKQTALLEQQAPKVAFAEAIVGSTNSILVGAMAKILTQNGFKIGQNQLFALLREEGYFGKHGERYNIPIKNTLIAVYSRLKRTHIVKMVS